MPPYNMAFACLECCKSFKRHVDLRQIPDQLSCPECGRSAYNLGRHFKAPRKTDLRQWEKIRFLLAHGFRFQKIRTGPKGQDTVPYPETLEEAKEFVVKYRAYARSYAPSQAANARPGNSQLEPPLSRQLLHALPYLGNPFPR